MDPRCIWSCDDCPTKRKCEWDRPVEKAEVAVVLDFPSEYEEKKEEFLAGRKGTGSHLLKAALEGFGLSMDEVYLTYAINCRPDPKKKAQHKVAMLACRERLIEELREAGVKKVLSVGPIGYGALLMEKKLPAITKIRGRWKKAFGMEVIATLPPGFVVGDAGYAIDFFHDLEKFITTDGRLPYPKVEVWIPDTVKELEEAFTYLAQFPHVGADVETTGFSPIACDVLAAGFAVLEDDGATVVIVNRRLLEKKKPWRMMSDLINSEQDVVFHNGKFDLQFFKQGFLDRGLRYRPQAIHDTMLLHYLLDERPVGKYKSHGLEAISRVRLDAPDYGIDVGKFLKEWEDATEYDRREMEQRLHVYLALDCYCTAKLFPLLWNDCLVEDKETELEEIEEGVAPGQAWTLLDLYEELLMPASLALTDVEHRGIGMDKEMYEKSRVELEGKAAALRDKIRSEAGKPELNPGSWQQIKALIYNAPDDPDDPGLGLPFGLSEDKDGKVYHTARRGGLQEGPTAAPVLKSLALKYPEHQELIDNIVEYRNLTKNIGTYVNGLLDRCDVDGRIRSTFNICGTATGRLSSSNPNLQNVPDASHTGIEIRGGLIADPGRIILEADYKQLEVRIAAWLSNDDNMRSVFESGRDPHQEIAFSIYKKPKEEITHYMRWLAKNILFGLLYGRGAESVATGPEQEDIAARGGERWGIKEVESFFASLLAEWKEFAAWQQSQKEKGYKNHEVRTPTGRRKRFRFISKHDGGYVGRASFNNPIQGTASDFTLAALVKLWEQLPEGAEVILTVHDSIEVECWKEQQEEVEEIMHRIMEEEPLFPIDVPLKIDLDASERWGQVEFEKQEMVVE
jgi:DNA polymerase-1